MEDILARLRLNDSRKPSSTHGPPPIQKADPAALDKLLTNLQDQNKALKKQERDMKADSESDNSKVEDRSSGSDLYTPASETFEMSFHGSSQLQSTAPVDSAEMRRIKQELAAAKNVINRQEMELAETRTLKHTMDQALGPEMEFGAHHEISDQAIGHLQSAFNASARPFTSRNAAWTANMTGRSDHRGRGPWNNQESGASLGGPLGSNIYANPLPTQSITGVYGDQASPIDAYTSGRSFSGSSFASVGYDGRMGQDGSRRNGGHMRGPPSALSSESLSTYGSYNGLTGLPNASSLTPSSLSPPGIPSQFSYQPRGLGAPISPIGTEFANGSLQGVPSPWPISVSD